jgi:hypothetical protein
MILTVNTDYFCNDLLVTDTNYPSSLPLRPPHNPPLFTSWVPCFLSGQRKEKHFFFILKFCSLRLARNSSWSGEPGPSSFGFQLRPGWFCFSVSLLFISFLL